MNPPYATTWRRDASGAATTPPAPRSADHPIAPSPHGQHPTLTAQTKALLDRARRARLRVAKVYTPAVAHVLYQELDVFIELSGRFGGTKSVAALVDEVLAAPLPGSNPVASNIEV